MMKFLDTTPFAYDENREPTQLVDLERHRISEPGRCRQVLRALKAKEAPVVIGLPEQRRLFTASLWSVDDAAERMIFHAPREAAVASIVRDEGRLWAAAYDGASKVQFDLHGRTLRSQGEFWVVGSRLPTALYVLPRRAKQRARPAQGFEPVVRFAHPAEPQRLVTMHVHDISPGGLSMRAGADAPSLPIGTLVCAAEVELEPGQIFFADFLVQNSLTHDDAVADEGAEPVRIGCAWARVSDAARSQLEEWAGKLEQRRPVLSLTLTL